MIVGAVIVLYGVTVLVFRDGDHRMDLTALRGTQPSRPFTMLDDEIEAGVSDREADEQWDPLPQRHSGRISYGESPRDPVKGGVEVYPLQVGPSTKYCCIKIVLYRVVIRGIGLRQQHHSSSTSVPVVSGIRYRV